MSLVDERADQLDHLRDPFGGVRFGHDRAGVERLHVTVEAGDLGGGQLEEVDTELAGLGRIESSTSVMLRTYFTV